MSYAERLARAVAWETEVMAQVRSFPHWQCERFGQANLPESMRCLIRKTPTLLRWMPDILAARSDGKLVLLEAKWTRQDSPNFDVEINSLFSLMAHCHAYEIPGYFVFPGFFAAKPSLIRQNARNGPPSQNGSGTPYLLIAKSLVTRTLADVLVTPRRDGTADRMMAAGQQSSWPHPCLSMRLPAPG
jgi:hypothetical protein